MKDRQTLTQSERDMQRGKRGEKLIIQTPQHITWSCISMTARISASKSLCSAPRSPDKTWQDKTRSLVAHSKPAVSSRDSTFTTSFLTDPSPSLDGVSRSCSSRRLATHWLLLCGVVVSFEPFFSESRRHNIFFVHPILVPPHPVTFAPCCFCLFILLAIHFLLLSLWWRSWINLNLFLRWISGERKTVSSSLPSTTTTVIYSIINFNIISMEIIIV